MMGYRTASAFVAAFLGLAAFASSPTAPAPAREFAPEALHGHVIGPVPAARRIQIHVMLPSRDEAGLDRLIALQQNPASRLYLHYLTPDQYGSVFGADPRAYARAIVLLRANGFHIDDLAHNRRDIVASAPALAVATFFRTPLDLHDENGRVFYAARFVPIVPSQLGGAIVTGLDDFHQLYSHARRRPWAIVHGAFSYSPQDLANTYELNGLHRAGLNGTGIVVANATSGAATTSDLKLFDSTFRLPAATLRSVAIDGPLRAKGNGESSLDVDSATSIAPDITFLQVVGHTPSNHDFDNVYKYIVDSLGSRVHVVTTSWGSCEQDNNRGEMALDNGYFKQAYAEGQWWFSAAGDQGTDDCEDGHTRALSVDFPGSSPYVVSVGGTYVETYQTKARKITGWKAERVWAFGNCKLKGNGDGSNGAGGGGASIVYAKPPFQQALTPADGARDVPDVSLISDDVNDGVFLADGGSIQAGIGGTSDAAPMWAALLAIVEQEKGSYMNVASPLERLYALAETSSYASYFHDVIGGNNGVPACAHDISVFKGFTAVQGFDKASGLGSFKGTNLVNAY